jgi:hypothetical protein
MSNYRTELITFEVVHFSRPYHVILGWPCYVKFMAIPSYAYLTAIVVAVGELRELCLSGVSSSTSPAMPPSSGDFEEAENANVIQINDEDTKLAFPSH